MPPPDPFDDTHTRTESDAAAWHAWTDLHDDDVDPHPEADPDRPNQGELS